MSDHAPVNVKTYTTPINYIDGKGKNRTAKLHFRLTPSQLMDWVFENPFEANELLAGMEEMRRVYEQESHDLSRENLMTMFGLIKTLAKISAGRPDADGDYFIKDPNWTSSYQYEGFRQFLMVNPKETGVFLNALLDNETITAFTGALAESNDRIAEEAAASSAGKPDSGPEVAQNMRTKLAQKEAELEALRAQQANQA